MSPEERLTRIETYLAAKDPGFVSEPAQPGGSGPSGRIAANVVPSGTPLLWSEQAGEDHPNVFQGWTWYPFTPPITGKYELSIGQQDPAWSLADVQIEDSSGAVVIQWRPAFGSFQEFTPVLQAGQTYKVVINPIEPSDGAGKMRFVAGRVERA